MKKKGETKRQHYVPRFVLRNFSEDEKHVGVLVLSDGKIVSRGPLKTQAYEDYFYGDDQILERAFADGETDVAARLSGLSDEDLNGLNSDDILQVSLFVHYQLFRTKAAVEQGDDMATAMSQRLLHKATSEKGTSLKDEEIRNVRVAYEDGPSSSILTATRILPVVQDLEFRFLRTRHTLKFIIGDHPVVLYNQFAEHHATLQSRGRATGLAAKGLQVLMPLSPTVCVMAFDSSTYCVDGTHRVCNIGPRDVAAINRMQVVNAWQCVFFDRRATMEPTLRELLEVRANHPGVHQTKVVNEGSIVGVNEQSGELLRVTRPDVRVDAHFSFLRVTDRSDYRDYTALAFPTRFPLPHLRSLLAVHEEVFNEEVAKARESANLDGQA
jgi:hypothetical protein